MNNLISTIILILLFPENTWASDGAGLGQAIFYLSMILFSLATVAFGLIIYGFIRIHTSKFRNSTHVVIFNLLNFTVLFCILLFLDAIGLSYIETNIKILVAALGMIQIFMFYKSIAIYRHNKSLN